MIKINSHKWTKKKLRIEYKKLKKKQDLLVGDLFMMKTNEIREKEDKKNLLDAIKDRNRINIELAKELVESENKVSELQETLKRKDVLLNQMTNSFIDEKLKND